jgi:hypothetical protein
VIVFDDLRPVIRICYALNEACQVPAVVILTAVCPQVRNRQYDRFRHGVSSSADPG